MNRPFPEPKVPKLRRHSTSSKAPYSAETISNYLRIIKIKQATIAANKAIRARIQFEGERAVEQHQRKMEKKQTLREANIRLRNKFPSEFSRA